MLCPLSTLCPCGCSARSARQIASQAARVPTLIFDEVDSGIGGAVAEVVGRLLGGLNITATTRRHAREMLAGS